MRIVIGFLAAVIAGGCAAAAPVTTDPAAADPPVVATFSIVARDPANGDLGIAVASKFLAVGAVRGPRRARAPSRRRRGRTPATGRSRSRPWRRGRVRPKRCSS
jgi:hypothetical protein